MSNVKLLEAKKLFMKYEGNHFQMERENVYRTYKKFHISKKQEKIWIKEYQQELFEKLKIEENILPLISKLTSTISRFKDKDCLKLMILQVKMKVNYVDSFTQMRIAEEILSAVESFNNAQTSDIVIDGKNLALNILKDIIKRPITVAEHYKSIEYLSDAIKEENIISRTKRRIQQLDCN